MKASVPFFFLFFVSVFPARVYKFILVFIFLSVACILYNTNRNGEKWVTRQLCDIQKIEILVQYTIMKKKILNFIQWQMETPVRL